MKKLLLAIVLSLDLVTSSFAGEMDEMLRATVMIDKFEYQHNDEKTISWDTYAYVGYDLSKVYIYSEGEKANGVSSAESENQLVYSRAISVFWDIQLGAGYDKAHEDDVTWGVVALQGLAPYFFETRASLLLGNDGEIGIRLETEYEALITQKLILTPRADVSVYTQNNEAMGTGSGLSNLKLGARLRYEIRREFAPYIGIEWSKNFGNTNDYNSLDEAYVTAGLRVWF